MWGIDNGKDGVGWADGHDDVGRKRRNEHRGTRTGQVDRVAGRVALAGMSGGRSTSVQTS
jgi:hypothetical protein